MSSGFKGFSVRELRFQRQHILRATMEAIGLLAEEAVSLDVLRSRIAAARSDVAAKLDAFLAADDLLLVATEQEDVSESEYAAAVTKRTMARNALEATAKMPRSEDV